LDVKGNDMVRIVSIIMLACLALIFGISTPAGATVRAQCGPGGPPGPWVALYRDINFQGDELCFVGQGSIDLINYGFDFQASSINVGANGFFIDGVGNKLGFWPGMRVADLRTMGWNDRIGSFQITG
jgi:hypothetical protein